MVHVKYLTLLMLLLVGSTSLWAQDDTFNPNSPDEPGPPGEKEIVSMLTLKVEPEEGGTVTGSGWYSTGAKITVRAYNKQNYEFDRWANADGETLSTDNMFEYTKQADDETLTAYFRFSPGNPEEPTEIAQMIYYLLTVKAEEGGTASGGGRYLPNTRVYLSSSADNHYLFSGWYNDMEELVSSDASFYYVTTAEPVTLMARFTFNPDSPDEPSEPVIKSKHTLTVTAEEGGTVNNTGKFTMREGDEKTLTATVNAGYVFDGWYVDNELYESSRSFSFTMGTADIAIVARFTFNPNSPDDPSKPDSKKYAFYLLNVAAKPGTTAQFPIYLSSLDRLADMTFQLFFPKELPPDLNRVKISSKAVGYEISASAVSDTIYSFKLTGGTVPDGNTPILELTVPIPTNIATDQNYPVKINQVSVTEADGTTITAATRNGRISVYRLCDINCDSDIDVLDILSEAALIKGLGDETFDRELSDVNRDGRIDENDIEAIIEAIIESVKISSYGKE